MARKTLAERRSEKLQELERIKGDLAKLEEKAATQIGKIAVRSGLADLELEEEQIAKEFATLVAKFQSKTEKKEKSSTPTDRSALQS